MTLLARSIEIVFPGVEATPAGRAQLEADFEAHDGVEGIADLGDWLGRRRAYFHPAYGRNDQISERRLPGPHKNGVGAAEIGTVRGADGLWYARHGYWLGDGGGSTPITHSPPHPTEAEAVAWAAGQIIARVSRGCLRTESAARWAAKVEAWCLDQITPQGELAL